MLDLVVLGYPPDDPASSNEQPLEDFVAHLNYPLVIICPGGANQFLLNQVTQSWSDDLQLSDGSWSLIEAPVAEYN